MILVTLQDVYKDYIMAKTRVPVLKGVNLQLAAGEMACLMGPSGSGKTTVLNIIGGIDFADRGRVSVYNQDLQAMGDKQLSAFRNKTLGFIFQYFNLIPVLTAFENIEYPLVLQRVGKKERRRRVEAMLEAVGLSAVKNHRPDELSGGQRQRVAIGRALITRPKLVIADEPTGNLDHRTGKAIMELMKEMNEKEKTTFIFATHDPMVSSYTRRVLHLLDGAIVKEEKA
ncbi:MAG: ABC transporter ATP-binding protein [Firmicutes bacterium]|nr:ABC transporter ATP-binding protein [Bacillota bacterium]